MFVDVREFGAVGDGRTLDTAALRRALEAVRAAGGGLMVFPPGTYRTGTLRLVDRVTLRLERGATLLGSPDIADYELDASVHPQSLRHYLLWGDRCREVAIEGDGVIDGNGAAFWEKEYFSGHTDATLPPERPIIDYEVYRPKDARPVPVYMAHGADLRVEGVTIVHSPAFTLWFVGCERVQVRGVTVRNPRNGPNTDVLDLDCCRRVRVSDCDFDAGDDCIALKSDPHRIGTPFACEDVVVSNCVLSSATCAVRVGYEGDAPIRDCLFENLAIRDSRHGLDILSIAPVCPAIDIRRGTPIDRLHFQNIVMRNVGQAFFVWAGNEPPRRGHGGHIRDLLFSGIAAESAATSRFASREATAIAGVTLRDVRLRVDEPAAPPPDADIRAVPGHWGGQWKSGGLALRGIDGLRADGVDVTTAAGVRPAWHWRGVTDFVRDGAALPPDGEPF